MQVKGVSRQTQGLAGGSLVREGNDVRFVITDTEKDIPVHYVGLLPDLFKEGRGVVAQGKLGEDVVIHMGTNGTVTEKDLRPILDLLRDRRRVVDEDRDLFHGFSS